MKNYSNDENTWERKENLNYPDLIAQFEKQQKKKEAKKRWKDASRKIRNTSTPIQAEEKLMGEEAEWNLIEFDTNLHPERIIQGVISRATGESLYLIQWKGGNNVSCVPAGVVNKKWPQLAIKFYEERIVDPIYEKEGISKN